MKLLATSDLHNRHDWYAWLHNKAPQYDAVVIAGDLLDMTQDLQPQIEFLRNWVADMRAVGTPRFRFDRNHFERVVVYYKNQRIGLARRLDPVANDRHPNISSF